MVWTITDVEKIKDCQARANSATAVRINPFSVAGLKKNKHDIHNRLSAIIQGLCMSGA